MPLIAVCHRRMQLSAVCHRMQGEANGNVMANNGRNLPGSIWVLARCCASQDLGTVDEQECDCLKGGCQIIVILLRFYHDFYYDFYYRILSLLLDSHLTAIYHGFIVSL